ncbi:hypothetical protein CPC735_010290 [Coccidioides posadasii C735 delta SOWgp]|uniref:Uncharacterized protein n=1 Tax=Coccidioides posadasii (strain C735) TaxID=222929 RepID=C5P881_COCP7|nr:hypothetical protein CPC735_010290 [Coccidioides posadasii C735 delta SOWgp]EER26852.1 hypothetical protein CPC735_010290 [Coccidioides posadasii C735 delta SOWgp]|eukprot:XP_003068997.1 hypothetical protein CPC735_010290 [Coccidioides posadasii C735 delta SOWgp]
MAWTIDQTGSEHQVPSNKKMKTQAKRKQKKTRKRADSAQKYSTPKWEGNNKHTGFINQNEMSHVALYDINEGVIVDENGYYWHMGYTGYGFQDGEEVGSGCPGPCCCADCQKYYGFYPANPQPWYACWPHEFYAPVSNNNAFMVPVTATGGSRLRAEAPEFVPAYQSFSSNDSEVAIQVDTLGRTDGTATVERMTEEPTLRRNITI